MIVGNLTDHIRKVEPSRVNAIYCGIALPMHCRGTAELKACLNVMKLKELLVNNLLVVQCQQSIKWKPPWMANLRLGITRYSTQSSNLTA